MLPEFLQFLSVVILALLLIISGCVSAEVLKIEKPELEWQSCCCNDMTLGLSDNDFMNFQVYMKSLEHRVQECEAR